MKVAVEARLAIDYDTETFTTIVEAGSVAEAVEALWDKINGVFARMREDWVAAAKRGETVLPCFVAIETVRSTSGHLIRPPCAINLRPVRIELCTAHVGLSARAAGQVKLSTNAAALLACNLCKKHDLPAHRVLVEG